MPVIELEILPNTDTLPDKIRRTKLTKIRLGDENFVRPKIWSNMFVQKSDKNWRNFGLVTKNFPMEILWDDFFREGKSFPC